MARVFSPIRPIILATTILFAVVATPGTPLRPAQAQSVDEAITFAEPGQTAEPEWWVDAGPGVTGIQRCRRIATTGAFLVDILISNVAGLGGFHFTFHFDSNYVSFLDADLGPLLTSGGGTVQVFDFGQPDANTLIVGAALEDPGPPGSGSDVLVQLVFSPKTPYGQTGLDLSPNSILSQLNGQVIASNTSEGKAQAVIDPAGVAGCWTVDSTGVEADLSIGDGIADANPALGVIDTTLSAAIAEANAIEGANRIRFRIPNAGLLCPAPCRIAPTNPLPPLSDLTGGTEIDGSTQPGILLSGVHAAAGADGIKITSADNIIRQLTINDFKTGTGVRITGGMASNNQVLGTRLGTNREGTAAVPNKYGVILEFDAHANRIGGMTPTDRNLISGHSDGGVYIHSTANDNHILYNFIGTNEAGTEAVGNLAYGILVQSSSKNTIEGNLISGNGDPNTLGSGSGVIISGAESQENRIVGNFIGVDIIGSKPLANRADGVFINGAVKTVVGGLTNLPGTSPGNVISGNQGNGVDIQPDSEGAGGQTTVQGNLIGTDSAGMKKVSNHLNGVWINHCAGNLIGGDVPSAGNVISGNGMDPFAVSRHGVYISGDKARDNRVQGNLIGTNRMGQADATDDIGNYGNGVKISYASSNLIGGATGILGRAPGNIIAGNQYNGVAIVGSLSRLNRIQGNLIGLPSDNSSSGIVIQGGIDNTIGGLDSRERNIISANGFHGVYLLADARNNKVLGNYIGTDEEGERARGNGGNGVLIEDARDNLIGGTTAGARNLIAANKRSGVEIAGAGATGNRVQGNDIGLSISGVASLGNKEYGVWIGAGASDNIIGGRPGESGRKNVVAYNHKKGVVVDQSGEKNSIDPNGIFANQGLGIDLGDDGITPNDAGDGDSGANGLQNFPHLAAAMVDDAGTRILGRLESTPNATFTLEFYANLQCDPSGYGEGESFLSAGTVTTDGLGNAVFTLMLPLVPAGQWLTATATDTVGNTSEFSACIAVTAGTASSTPVFLPLVLN